MSPPRIVPTLNSFWLAPKSFIVFEAIAFDELKQTVTIQQIQHSELYEIHESFMDTCLHHYGPKIAGRMGMIEKAVGQLPEDWAISRTMELTLPINIFIDNGFEPLECDTALGALDRAVSRTETAAFQHMLDNGTMGFDSIAGVNA